MSTYIELFLTSYSHTLGQVCALGSVAVTFAGVPTIVNYVQDRLHLRRTPTFTSKPHLDDLMEQLKTNINDSSNSNELKTQ